jgi:HEAT repeat protein
VGLRKLLDADAVPALLAALDDPLEPVAARAAALLSQPGDPDIDRRLVLRLERATERERMLRLIAALGLRKTDAARRALRARAAGWFPFWGTAAVVRKAARAALEGHHE